MTTPRGIRNNNPGNIRNSNRTSWQGEVDVYEKKDLAFEEFKSLELGIRAMMKLLQNYQKDFGLNTISGLINRWAPSSENNTAAYIRSVCKQMQIPDSCPINLQDKATMCALVEAMILVENGMAIEQSTIESGWNLL